MNMYEFINNIYIDNKYHKYENYGQYVWIIYMNNMHELYELNNNIHGHHISSYNHRNLWECELINLCIYELMYFMYLMNLWTNKNVNLFNFGCFSSNPYKLTCKTDQCIFHETQFVINTDTCFAEWNKVLA